MARPRTDKPSHRTLQRRSREAGETRFAWSDERDEILRQGWLNWSWSRLSLAIGCGKRCLRQRAADLGLPPRDAVQRALVFGRAPTIRGAITLPTGFDDFWKSYQHSSEGTS